MNYAVTAIAADTPDRLMRFIEAPCVVFGPYEGDHHAPTAPGSRSRPPTRSPAVSFGATHPTVQPPVHIGRLDTAFT